MPRCRHRRKSQDATGTSRNLVREKRRNFKHADSDPIGYFPKKLSGEENLEPHVKPRRNQQSDSVSDGNERRHVATKHEDAIEGETSDTDDYETDHSDDSVRGERPTPSP